MSAAEEVAARLEAAWISRVPIEPPSAAGTLRDVAEAYAAQRAWAGLRAAAGETTVGRKIGLTSPGMQRQMGVDEPDFGDLWGSRALTVADGTAEVEAARFLQPRVEGELAFLLRDGLRGPGVTEADVLGAAEAAAPAIEVVDSRIADWRIGLVDTIADNASFGAFAHGPWSEELLHADLPALPMELAQGGRVVMREHGSAVLGSPLTAVAWLANKLGEFGEAMRPGDVVLSGAFGPAAPATAGDVFVVAVPGADPLELRFR